jgi:hypothetical protein
MLFSQLAFLLEKSLGNLRRIAQTANHVINNCEARRKIRSKVLPW